MTYKQLQPLVDKAWEANNNGNYIEAERLVNEMLAELDNVSDSEHSVPKVETLRANAFLLLSDTERQRGQYDSALEQARQALALSEKYGIQDLYPKALHTIGIMYYSLSDYPRALEFYGKALAVIRSFFFQKNVCKCLVRMALHNLLQDSLAIIKELFVFHIVQNKSMNKLFCISKTTIQINCPDHSFKRIRQNRFAASSSGLVLSFSE